MAGSTSVPFDVVGVPDFAGEKPLLFEARTLFFLGSWIERAGAAREFPLHLACIGEPPDSVKWLSERAGASITVHEPKSIHGSRFDNKMRCFEVEGRTEHILHVDMDVLMMGDPSPLGEMAGCVAAWPDGSSWVPNDVWRRALEFLGVEVPAEEEAPEPGKKDAKPRPIVSFCNGGIFWAPWASGFSELWLDHMLRLEEFKETLEEPYKSSREFAGDEVSLATSVKACQASGVPFKPLPVAFNTPWRAVADGELDLDDVRLFHIFRLLKPLDGRRALAKAVWTDCKRATSHLFKQWGPLRYPASLLWFLPTTKKLRAFQGFLRLLHERHALVALKHSGREGLF